MRPLSLVLWLLAIVCAESGCAQQSTLTHKQSIQPLPVPADNPSAMPRLTSDTLNRPILSWIEYPVDRSAGPARLVFSRLVNQQWSESREVSRGDDWFINWADFPSVVAVTEQHWAAHWLVKSAQSTYAYNVVVSQSIDGGETWGTPVVAHTDGTQTEHGFATLFPNGGAVGAIWLDGRETGSGGAMTLRTTTIGKAGVLDHNILMDNSVCDCCQTHVAMAEEGPVVAFRNRTAAEIRDIYVSRMLNGKWQSPVPVFRDNWEIAGCPVNGPAIAASGNQVAVAWFTMANDRAQVKLARSSNGGATFNAPIVLDDENPLGRVGLVLLDDQSAVVAWLRPIDNVNAEIVVRRVSEQARVGDPVVIATVAASRLSGFPQITLAGNQLVLAWTGQNERQRTVKSARLPVRSLP